MTLNDTLPQASPALLRALLDSTAERLRVARAEGLPESLQELLEEELQTLELLMAPSDQEAA